MSPKKEMCSLFPWIFEVRLLVFLVYSPGDHLNLDGGFNHFVCSPSIWARLDEPNLTFSLAYFFRKGGKNSTTNQGATDFNRMFPKIVVPPNHPFL